MASFLPRRVVGLLLSLLLAACGPTRVAYDNADVAVLVMANRYLDLEGEQWQLARGAIDRFHAWHRRAELAHYAALLQDTAGRVRGGLTRDDVQWGIASLRERYAVLVTAAVRESAPLLARLDADNVAALARHFTAEDRKRAREHVSGDPGKRERDRIEAIRRRVEEWIGPLAEAQMEPVRGFVQATRDYPQRAHESRLRMQRELVQRLERDVGTGNGALAAELQSFLIAWASERDASTGVYEARFVELIVELDRTLTPTQRAHVVKRLERYADDFQVLARRA